MVEWLRIRVCRFLIWLNRYLRPRPGREHWLVRLIRKYVSIVRWHVRNFVRIYSLLTLSQNHRPKARDECIPPPLPTRRTRRLTISSLAGTREANPQTSLQPQARLFSKLPPEIRQSIFGYAIAGNTLHITRMPLRLGHVTCFEPSNFIGLTPWNTNRSLHECWGMEVRGSTLYHGPFDKSRCNDRDGLLNLSKSCRRIYSETIDLIYTGNVFDTNAPLCMNLLFDTVLPHRFNMIRSLETSWKISAKWFTEQPSPSQEKHEYDRAWLILFGMENLRKLSVELSVASFYPSMTQAIEKNIFMLPWKVELPQKWELVTNWHLGDSGTDVNGAPFRITRRPVVLSDRNCWY